MNLTDDDKKWIEALMERFATKEDIQRVETKLERYATKEDLERVETNLLTQFHAWASPTEARQRLHSANFRTIELELQSLTDRIKKLEGPGPS